MNRFLKINKSDLREIFENAISWIVVFAMLVYGAAKIVQFDGAANIDKMVSQMTGMELMWSFYGYSKPFVIILGMLEITGGILILIKRTRILGCFFTTTILVNIILQDIFYSVHLGALKAAILYQLIILIILWMNKSVVIDGFKVLLRIFKQPKQTWSKRVVKLILAFLVFVVLRIGEFYVTIKW